MLSNKSLLLHILNSQCTAQCSKVLNHRCHFPAPTALANHELKEVTVWLWEVGSADSSFQEYREPQARQACLPGTSLLDHKGSLKGKLHSTEGQHGGEGELQLDTERTL